MGERVSRGLAATGGVWLSAMTGHGWAGIWQGCCHKLYEAGMGEGVPS
jgi:hypothetical protein